MQNTILKKKKKKTHYVDILGVTDIIMGKMIRQRQVLVLLYISCFSDLMIL